MKSQSAQVGASFPGGQKRILKTTEKLSLTSNTLPLPQDIVASKLSRSPAFPKITPKRLQSTYQASYHLHTLVVQRSKQIIMDHRKIEETKVPSKEVVLAPTSTSKLNFKISGVSGKRFQLNRSGDIANNLIAKQRSKSYGFKTQEVTVTSFGLREDQRHLFNLFNGIAINLEDLSPGFKPRFFVGKGNNQPLVTDMLSKRSNFVLVAQPGLANVMWTQLENKELKKTGLTSCARLHIEDIKKKEQFKTVEFTDTTKLTLQFSRLRMFCCNNPTLIKEVFDHILYQKSVHIVNPEALVMPNHIRGSFVIGRKSLLTEMVISHMSKANLDPFKVIPRTFLIKMESYIDDMKTFKMILSARSNYAFPLIIKPGEFSNRGNGIQIAYKESELDQIVAEILTHKEGNTQPHCAIVQNYITNPLLYKERKFDMRCYALLVRTFGRLSFYWYGEGYARTSSYVYNTSNRDNLMVHLTNEAVQVKSRFKSSR